MHEAPRQQETHVFSWQGWGEWTEHNSCTKETKKKRVCLLLPCQRGSAGRWGGVESAGQQDFYLFDAGRAFKVRGLLMVSVCECKSRGSKSEILRGGLCSTEQWAERTVKSSVWGVMISSTFLGTLCVCGCQLSCFTSLTDIWKHSAVFN